MVTLAGKMIKGATGEYDLEVVRVLILTNERIDRLGDDLMQCKKMERLDLSYNKLISVRSLAQLPALKRLNLEFNKLCSISGIESLVNLEVLDLRGNMLRDVGMFEKMANLKALRQLWLQSCSTGSASATNPCCEHPSYPLVVRKHLPALETHDDEDLRLTEYVGDTLLQSVEPDKRSLMPLPQERWLAKAPTEDFLDKMRDETELFVDGGRELDTMQEDLKEVHFAVVNAERLVSATSMRR